MNKPTDSIQWCQYLETPERKRSPVKLEHILAQRIEAFLQAKKIKTVSSDKSSTS